MGTTHDDESYESVKTIRPANLAKKLASKSKSGRIPSIALRGGRKRLRVGALAWSQFEMTDQRWVTDQELSTTLRLIAETLREEGSAGIDADVILCCGAAVWDDREADESTIAAEVTKASGGVPVLVEYKYELSDPAEWYLAKGNVWHMIRTCQYFSESTQTRGCGHEVLEEIDSGYGRIRVEGADQDTLAELVLVLCNEARLLQRTTDAGLFRNIAHRPDPLPEPFYKKWFLLHPSHRPYANSRQRGVGLVAPWYNPATEQTERPVFEVATKPLARETFDDKSRPPEAIVHAGPFSPNRDSDREVATIAFAGGAVAAPSRQVNVPGVVEVQYSEYEFTI